MQEYTIESGFAFYAAAQEQFVKLVDELNSSTTQTLEHGDVESLIAHNGKEILRLLMQGYLNQKSAKEEPLDAVVGTDGQERRYQRERVRNLATLFGDVCIHRLGYSGPELDSVFPLDQALNLPIHKYSQGLQRKVGLEAAKCSFDKTIEGIQEYTGVTIPKRQVEQLTQAVSIDFDDFYEQKQQEVNSDADLLVMTTDSKGIVMRTEDLRDATRKAAEKSKHKIQTRLSTGEKHNRKRMATVASVYEARPHQRTAEQIMGQDDDGVPERPEISNKRVWASVRKSQSEVIEQMFAEAERRDPERKKQRLVLIDGQEAQLRAVEAAIAKSGTNVVIIQDFIHVLEYLWKAAYCFYPPGTQEAEDWVMNHALAILNGKISDTAAGMRRSATRRNLSQEERVPVDKCANYLINNKDRLDYATALANGWPIATGVIEGACRHLVKDRMDLTGARWSLDGAEAVLRLRALCASKDLDDYMDFHQRKERQRNYVIPKMAA